VDGILLELVDRPAAAGIIADVLPASIMFAFA
jgi:hypothetical protein